VELVAIELGGIDRRGIVANYLQLSDELYRSVLDPRIRNGRAKGHCITRSSISPFWYLYHCHFIHTTTIRGARE
jgi:hypothetical protein